MGMGWHHRCGQFTGRKDLFLPEWKSLPFVFPPKTGTGCCPVTWGGWNALLGLPDLFSYLGVTGGSFSESTQ